MFYTKNLPGWERALRVAMGLMMIVGGLMFLKGQVAGYVIAAAGAMAGITGFIGFCPMCAMVGRKLSSKPR
jgi:Inner membrane protein YgaP-like, transmembrane domain